MDIHGPVPTFSDAAVIASNISRRRGNTRIVYTHEWEIDFPHATLLGRLYNRWHRWIANAADHVVVTTPSYAHLFLPAQRENRLSIIPWGVDTAAFSHSGQKSPQFTVLFVGQLRPYKGLDVLIRAMTRLPRARLIIVGGGTDRSKSEALAQRLGLEGCEFRGNVSDSELAKAFGQSHVVVLPSVSKLEAFGLVLLEGMAAGCVPVASHLPGLCDVALASGYTFPPHDVEALASVLRLLNDDQDLWAQRSKLSRVRAKDFSWERAVSARAALYEDLTADRPPRRVESLPAFGRA